MSPRTPTQANAAVGLIRVSTDEQADSRLGLEAQRHALAEAAERLGLQLVQVIEEAGVSGGLEHDKRAGLLQAVDAVPRGGVLLVAKLDRLGRDRFVQAWVEKELKVRGARVVSAAGEGTDTDDDIGGLILRRVTEMFAEVEREQIKVRTKVALAAKRRRGEKLGGTVPLGFDVEQDSNGTKRLVPSKRDQNALALMRTLHAKGYSLRAIGAELHKRGHKTKRGGKWHAKVIRSALQRQMVGAS
jgi:DNA invertase Pin-like site-specific DNA recombinase